MRFPDSLKYTKDHEWAKVNGKSVQIGITDHAQGSLGDIVYVDLPKPGRELKKGETFGVVESIKAVSDLYSPVNGKVTQVNGALTGDPSLINREPHGSWMIEIEVADAGALDGLMDAKAYEAFVATL